MNVKRVTEFILAMNNNIFLTIFKFVILHFTKSVKFNVLKAG